jgi:hypothetical protein
MAAFIAVCSIQSIAYDSIKVRETANTFFWRESISDYLVS